MKWNEDEINYLRKGFKVLSKNELCEKLNRKWGAIFAKAKDFGLDRDNFIYHWTEERIRILEES